MSKRKLKITIEDESTLEQLYQKKASPAVWLAIFCGLIVIVLSAGALIMAFSPVKQILPGYMADEERSATEEQHLRLDSLLEVYEKNAVYLENINTLISMTDSNFNSVEIKENLEIKNFPDTLTGPSEKEINFSNLMREKEKYNAAYIAPLAAQNVVFGKVNNESLITEESKNSIKAEVLIPNDGYIGAIADGTILAVSTSINKDEITSVIIQHKDGFISRYSKLGHPLVHPGDNVVIGQAIALKDRSPFSSDKGIYLEMWHNGNRLVPYEYVMNDKEKVTIPIVDEDVGRGRL